MKIEAFKMFLKPGFEEEYERRHREIWPEVKALLKESGVYEYSFIRSSRKYPGIKVHRTSEVPKSYNAGGPT